MELGSAARWGNREACGAPTGQASMGRDGLRGQRVLICMHALRCVCVCSSGWGCRLLLCWWDVWFRSVKGLFMKGVAQYRLDTSGCWCGTVLNRK